MLDIRLIREKPDFVKAELAKCGVDPAEIDQILETDARRRRLQHELDDLRAQRTRESRELGKASPEERERRRARAPDCEPADGRTIEAVDQPGLSAGPGVVSARAPIAEQQIPGEHRRHRRQTGHLAHQTRRRTATQAPAAATASAPIA